MALWMKHRASISVLNTRRPVSSHHNVHTACHCHGMLLNTARFGGRRDQELGCSQHGLLWKLKQDSLRCFAMIRTACFILAFACPWCWTTSLPHNALQAKGSGFAAKAMCIQHSTWIPQSCLVLIRSDEEKKQPAHMDSSFHSADSLIQHSSTRYCYLILEPSLLLSEILNLYLLH
jgi:hypothetical protein